MRRSIYGYLVLLMAVLGGAISVPAQNVFGERWDIYAVELARSRASDAHPLQVKGVERRLLTEASDGSGPSTLRIGSMAPVKHLELSHMPQIRAMQLSAEWIRSSGTSSSGRTIAESGGLLELRVGPRRTRQTMMLVALPCGVSSPEPVTNLESLIDRIVTATSGMISKGEVEAAGCFLPLLVRAPLLDLLDAERAKRLNEDLRTLYRLANRHPHRVGVDFDGSFVSGDGLAYLPAVRLRLGDPEAISVLESIGTEWPTSAVLPDLYRSHPDPKVRGRIVALCLNPSLQGESGTREILESALPAIAEGSVVLPGSEAERSLLERQLRNRVAQHKLAPPFLAFGGLALVLGVWAWFSRRVLGHSVS